MSFKTEFSFDERKTEANRVCAKYKDRVPVICERLSNSNIQVGSLSYSLFTIFSSIKFI